MKPGHSPTGVYLYCITEGEPVAAEEVLHPSRPVHSLVYENLVAVASRVPLEEFGEGTLHAHLEDPDWLEREVRGHERVVEKVMASRTVLPMKFCTIFRTGERLRALLESRKEEFRRTLATLREKEEWEVKMYFEPTAAAARRTAAQARANLSGKDFLLKRKAEDIEAWQAMTEAHQQAQQSFEKVCGHAESIQLKLIPPQDSSSGPKLLLDVACLLAKPRVKAFCQQLEGLGNELSGRGFRLLLTGPWPPYHFATGVSQDVAAP